MLARRLLDIHGYTQGRVGCGALQIGASWGPRTKYCRARVLEELNGSGEGRGGIQRAEERFASNQRTIAESVAFGQGDVEAPQDSDSE